MISIIFVICYLIFAPVLGGLLSGIDRKITARMQGRRGPSVFQSFYDVAKLMQKESLVVRRSQTVYVVFFLLFMIFTGALFFAGGDLLLVIFSLTLAGIFLVLGAFKASSPYSYVGAVRELIQMMAYEPMILIMAVSMYLVTGSFQVKHIIEFNLPLIFFLPGIFLGFIYILTIKFRKSPFDLSTSHHGHQELVKGLTTEFSGPALGLIEIAHWYENIFLLGFVFLFFSQNIILGIILTLFTYFLEIVIDNSFARMKWQFTLSSSWLVALVFGCGNLFLLFIL
ncbi:MAG: complex I subunit 1 family protein [Candidatus Margulisiibacteriota bacterium]|jgi:formate hydrogenlyase subunit 4